MNDATEELCLVVPRERLVSALGTLPNGFLGGGIEATFETVSAFGRFLPRSEAEEDPSFKQIIPYCVVQHRQDVFLMRRKPGGGERRLHDKLSIGVGGHVNPVDAEGDDLSRAVLRGLDRELREELRLSSPSQRSCLGLLNDDSNAVGRVHLGIVFRLELERPSVEVRERHSLEGDFVPRSTLPARRDRMETWSGLLAPLVAEDTFGSAGDTG